MRKEQVNIIHNLDKLPHAQHSGARVKGILTFSIFASININIIQIWLELPYFNKIWHLKLIQILRFIKISIFQKFATLRHTKNIFFN